MDIMQKKKQEMRKAFLKLTPMERIVRMSSIFNDIIALKADTAGVSEHEVYKRYLKPRK